jgi:hypothetical protein
MNTDSLTHLSKIVWRKLFAKYPEWERFAETVVPDYEPEESKVRSLYLRVLSPADENCCLSVLERGDCIEIAFSDGRPPGGAERQIICDENSEGQCVNEAIEFIEDILNERVVLCRERATWPFRWWPPSFLDANEIESKKKRPVSIRSWRGTFNKE